MFEMFKNTYQVNLGYLTTTKINLFLQPSSDIFQNKLNSNHQLHKAIVCGNALTHFICICKN